MGIGELLGIVEMLGFVETLGIAERLGGAAKLGIVEKPLDIEGSPIPGVALGKPCWAAADGRLIAVDTKLEATRNKSNLRVMTFSR